MNYVSVVQPDRFNVANEFDMIQQKSTQCDYIGLDQTCTTCGPRKLLMRPATPQILFILLLSLIKHPLKCVQTNELWPLDLSKKKFWPVMRFELCTPGLDDRPALFNPFATQHINVANGFILPNFKIMIFQKKQVFPN